MHIIKVHSWLNGGLSTFEEFVDDLDQAMAKVSAHHRHHSEIGRAHV